MGRVKFIAKKYTTSPIDMSEVVMVDELCPCYAHHDYPGTYDRSRKKLVFKLNPNCPVHGDKHD